MQRARPRRDLAAGAAGATVLAALIGTWVGHTLEYARVAGGAASVRSLLAGVHIYMLPVGGLLLLIAMLGGARCWQAWVQLGRRLERAREALVRAWRGEPVSSTTVPPSAPVSPPARLIALWLPLGAAQIVLYLVQENLEAVISGATTPGLRPVLGVHWAAVAIQLGVALIVAAALLLAGRQLAGRARRAETCERLLRALWARLLRDRATPNGARTSIPSPVERFGGQLWSRPPPVLA